MSKDTSDHAYQIALMQKAGNARPVIARQRAPRKPRTIDATPAKSGKPGFRIYQAARNSRLTSGFGTITTSADSELMSSLTRLRNISRAIVRDAAYAKRAKRIIQDNIVGSGINMQAQVMSTRDALRKDVNDAIEEAWEDWSCAEYCHTGGKLHFSDLERAMMGQIFEAGEVFIRKHSRPFGDSQIPFALELIEPERIADELMNPVPGIPATPGAIVKMGVEADRFGRPLAYYVRSRHPGELRVIPGETDTIERVPAAQIVHLHIIDRWPQTRGEPWTHSVARKLNDMDGYSEAEIVAARANANAVFTIESPDPNNPLAGQNPAGGESAGADISKEFAVEAGMGIRLDPGEEFKAFVPTRPNSALDPFMRYMLREVAAGLGVSYESLSKDYSQSNYSSSRLSVIEDRDVWKMFQQWLLRNFRLPIHKEWLQAAVLSRAISAVRIEEYAADPKKFEAVLFKPRGWTWVDPSKDVDAFEKAVKAGFTTRSDVIAATNDGRDIEDVDRQRERELKNEAQLKLEFTTSPSVYVPAATKSGQGGSGSQQDGAPPGDGASPGGEKKATTAALPLRAVS